MRRGIERGECEDEMEHGSFYYNMGIIWRLGGCMVGVGRLEYDTGSAKCNFGRKNTLLPIFGLLFRTSI